MKYGGPKIFINPDLLKFEYGYEILHDFLLKKPDLPDYVQFSDVDSDGKIVVEPIETTPKNYFMFKVKCAIERGLWLITLNSLMDYLGIED